MEAALNCWDCCINMGAHVGSKYRLYWCKGCVIYKEKMKEEKTECEIWLRSSEYIGEVKAKDWKHLQGLLGMGYYITRIVKKKIEVDSYHLD